MATPIEIWSKVEVRGVVRFLHAQRKNPTEIHVQIAKNIWGGCYEQAASIQMVLFVSRRPY